MYDATWVTPHFTPQITPQTVPKTQKIPPYLVDMGVNSPQYIVVLEAPPGFEPGNQGFADPRLTTWLWRQKNSALVYDWSGKRDSNPRHSPWQGDALPLSYSRIINYSALLWWKL